MKNSKIIIGITLAAQSVLCFILFLVYWSKNKSLAKAFAAFSAVGGIASAAMLVWGSKECGCCGDEALTDGTSEDEEAFDDIDFDDDDIFCDFEGENDPAEQKDESAEEASSDSAAN